MYLRFWQEINNFEKDLYNLEEKNSVADNYLKNLESEITRLSEINSLNDSFFISTVNEIGMINGLKLGKKTTDSNVKFVLC